MASSLRCNHDISFIPAQSGFLGLVYYITDYATKIAKLLYHYFSIAVALVPSRQSSNRDSSEDEESDSFKSRRFLTRVYNKTAIAREISGPEIANVMLGQPESYSNARFTTLNYNSLYSEMLTMFPHLRVERLVEDSREEPTVNIVDRNTAKDQFVDYKLRGSVLQRLCLYDYKSIVYTKVASEIEREKAQEEMDGCAHFTESHLLYGQQIQRVYETMNDYKVIGFTGKQPLPSAEEDNADERLTSLCKE